MFVKVCVFGVQKAKNGDRGTILFTATLSGMDHRLQRQTSSWYLIGFPNRSNLGSTVSCRGETRRYTDCTLTLVAIHFHSVSFFGFNFALPLYYKCYITVIFTLSSYYNQYCFLYPSLDTTIFPLDHPLFLLFFFFFFFFNLTCSRWTSSLPSCLWSLRIFPSLPGSRLPIFYREYKFSTLTTRQPMVEFYLLTFPRFPLRKKEHKSYFSKNRTHDFRTSRCAVYLLDHSGDDLTIARHIFPTALSSPLSINM